MVTFEDLVSYPGNIIRVDKHTGVELVHDNTSPSSPHCKYCRYCTGGCGEYWVCKKHGEEIPEYHMKGTECDTFEDRLENRLGYKGWTLDEILGL